VASLEVDNLVVFCYLSASELWPNKRGDLWWDVPYKMETTVFKIFHKTHYHKTTAQCFKLNKHGIETFCSLYEISIFSNCGHLWWRVGIPDILLKVDKPSTISVNVCFNEAKWFVQRGLWAIMVVIVWWLDL